MADKENQETFTREVVESITLGRDGKRVKLTTGMKFDFTQEELDAIKASSPNAISSKMIVDMDSADADLSLREIVQQPNQTSQPTGKGSHDKDAVAAPAPKTAADKKAAAKASKNADDEL